MTRRRALLRRRSRLCYTMKCAIWKQHLMAKATTAAGLDFNFNFVNGAQTKHMSRNCMNELLHIASRSRCAPRIKQPFENILYFPLIFEIWPINWVVRDRLGISIQYVRSEKNDFFAVIAVPVVRRDETHRLCAQFRLHTQKEPFGSCDVLICCRNGSQIVWDHLAVVLIITFRHAKHLTIEIWICWIMKRRNAVVCESRLSHQANEMF